MESGSDIPWTGPPWGGVGWAGQQATVNGTDRASRDTPLLSTEQKVSQPPKPPSPEKHYWDPQPTLPSVPHNQDVANNEWSAVCVLL
ncbi:hypothetical protein PtA15_3A84 [Puccinia triticina]|uniref:Uncharacterized protein n=1 Tax=Puccinia triticina TaxID=208348 RepID=A0ABY7CC81_9BASI|nr:uncharacterized protein PtA15_3A84 [Puccinia triticina]WAQ82720.1 hypothetical protein PtA15_3A84 [Puccinia triticina]WAR53559.1 hypothetical protein PtB15_3B67 [Puccinia triticina]